jgi:hypothetical protein
MQVPSTLKRPWLAGGGATVQGVPEAKSVQPFLPQGNLIKQYQGKRGTYALMADGSVRFIPENISDEVFKAMCTIKGGEASPLNQDAPKVKPEESSSELRAETPATPPAKPAAAPAKAPVPPAPPAPPVQATEGAKKGL